MNRWVTLNTFWEMRTCGGRNTKMTVTELKTLLDVTPERAVQFTEGGQLLVYPRWPLTTDNFVLSVTPDDKQFVMDLLAKSKVLWTPNLERLLKSWGVQQTSIDRLKTLKALR